MYEIKICNSRRTDENRLIGVKAMRITRQQMQHTIMQQTSYTDKYISVLSFKHHNKLQRLPTYMSNRHLTARMNILLKDI